MKATKNVDGHAKVSQVGELPGKKKNPFQCNESALLDVDKWPPIWVYLDLLKRFRHAECQGRPSGTAFIRSRALKELQMLIISRNNNDKPRETQVNNEFILAFLVFLLLGTHY